MPESASGALPARPDQVKNDGRVRTLFSEIAPRYDLLNHVLSLNIDRRWRKAAVDALLRRMGQKNGRVLDSCAGTFDLSLELVRRREFGGKIVASDFAAPMLVAGLEKIEGRPITPVCGDGLQLPFPDKRLQGAMVAFGVRNLASVDRGFEEFHRVLDDGAPLVVLEFTTPPNAFLRGLYLFYFHRILPIIGRIISGHRWAYTYLPESVKDFPGPEALAEKLRKAGFREVEWRYLSGGIAALHIATRMEGGRAGPSPLALRTEEDRPPAEDQSLDHRSALRAGLPIAPVHPQLHRVLPRTPFRRAIVAQRGPARPDRFA